MATRRIVMKNGGMVDVITTSSREQHVCCKIAEVDNWLLSLRETIRRGDIVEGTV